MLLPWLWVRGQELGSMPPRGLLLPRLPAPQALGWQEAASTGT